jgi:predicted metalloprotease with PDZ domain
LWAAGLRAGGGVCGTRSSLSVDSWCLVTRASARVPGWLLACVFCCFFGGASCGGWNGSVGAILGKDNRTGRVYVRQVPPGLGAARAGIEEGDELTAIDGKPVGEMSADAVRDALRGKVGTYVWVTVQHRGEMRTVHVERSPFQE